MRRMRALAWYLLFAIPGVAVAFGIQYVLKRYHPEPGVAEVATSEERQSHETRGSGPSHGDSTSKVGAVAAKVPEVRGRTTGGSTVAAKVPEARGRTTGGSAVAVNVPEVKVAKVPKSVREADKPPVAAAAAHEVAREVAHEVTHDSSQQSTAAHIAQFKREETRHLPAAPVAPQAAETTEEYGEDDVKPLVVARTETSAKRLPASALSSANDASCSSVEYRGDGPAHSAVSGEDWTAVMTQFHDLKESYQRWLNQHRKEMPLRTAELLEEQMRSLKIQRPPAEEEPDLSWRGVGVLVQNSTANSLLRVGGGFVKLIRQQPQRGRFELARLMAQAWAPCELKRFTSDTKRSEVWGPLLGCLGVEEEAACSGGTYSEAGWAVSSTVAAVIAPPGCNLPVFQEPAMASCMKKIPFAGDSLHASLGARSIPWVRAARDLAVFSDDGEGSVQ